MAGKPKYLARHNKVWQRIKDKKEFGNAITLEKGETITSYRQIDAKKEQAKPNKGNKSDNPAFFSAQNNGGTNV